MKTQPIPTPQPKVADLSNLTPEERAIFARVSQDDESWETITEESSHDFALARDPFELPEPAKKLREKKEFAFRWITRKPERLDEVKNKPIPFRWWPVNLNQPVGMAFKPFIDPNNGCVSREDQMLVFKPWWMFERELRYKQGLADAGYNQQSIEKRRAEWRSDVEIEPGLRDEEQKSLRQEIKGSDIQFRGEEEVDQAAGRIHPGATSKDLDVIE